MTRFLVLECPRCRGFGIREVRTNNAVKSARFDCKRCNASTKIIRKGGRWGLRVLRVHDNGNNALNDVLRLSARGLLQEEIVFAEADSLFNADISTQ